MSNTAPLLITGFTGCPFFHRAVDAAVQAGVPFKEKEFPSRAEFKTFLQRPDVAKVVGGHSSSPAVVNHEGSINDLTGATLLGGCDSLLQSLEEPRTTKTTPVENQPSSNQNKKIVVVIGATGAQGGGLARALVANGVYAVRGVTRNPASEKAQALTALGVDVVQAELDDVESLKQVFEGAYGAYFVTNYWEHMSVEKEIQQIKNLADAARDTGIEHVVLSTLEDTRKFIKEGTMPKLHGDMYVPDFDGKASVTDYVSKAVPTTEYLPCFYYENFINFGMGPKPDAKGNLALTFPLGDVPFAAISAEDIGVFAAKVFEHPELIGKTVGVAAQKQTIAHMAATFTKVLGKPVSYNAVAPEVYAKFPIPGADELANMFQFNRDHADTFNKTRDLEAVRKIVPGGLKQFETWLQENKAAFENTAVSG